MFISAVKGMTESYAILQNKHSQKFPILEDIFEYDVVSFLIESDDCASQSAKRCSRFLKL